MNDYIAFNNPWFISVLGGVIAAIIIKIIFRKKATADSDIKFVSEWKKNENTNNLDDHNNNENINNVNINIGQSPKQDKNDTNNLDISSLKKIVKILFIDDDKNFQIVNILKNQGWKNVRIITDTADVEKHNDIHIFFVDINGVGKKLNLVNEGMDLALCIKNRYPKKKIIIYSTDINRDITHPVFKAVDGILQKNAQVYQFTDYIEEFAQQIEL